MVETTNYLSKKAHDIVDGIRKTLLNLDLAIANAETIIATNAEIMDFHSASTKKSDLRAFTEAKIDKENYEVFLYRLKKQKKDLLSKVELIAKKYEGDYSQIFMWHFFEHKTSKEIAELLDMRETAIKRIIFRMENDILKY